MSIAEAAEFFGISKEAIHNRIRRGSLKTSLSQEGVKCVHIDTTKKTTPKKAIKRSTNNDERYYKLLEQQNEKLQARVEILENETRTLRDQKEQMLIEEKKKIETIYKEKDEQLKNLLQTISSQFIQNTPPKEQEETLEAEMIELKEEQVQSNVISLKKYLKSSGFSEKKIKKIKKIFKKKAKKDERIIIIGKKIYLDTIKYNYQDLIK